jgi:ectoine hydroxylase-related dioxygenase (phytanoyl-CoA dioxygenase family)
MRMRSPINQDKEHPVFQNPLLQAAFRKDGFVVLDMLSEAEFKSLRLLVTELHLEGQGTALNQDASYRLSFFSDSSEYRKKVFEVISEFIQPFLDKYLCDYHPLMVNVFNKEPGTGEVPVHQNWTFVDESAFRSVSFWIPFVDVTRENGTMELVRGSQDGVSAQRGPLIPWVFSDIVEIIKSKHMEPINLKIGEVVIIDDAVIHYTSVNSTDTGRLAVQVIAKPRRAVGVHLHRPHPGASHLEVFEVDSEFFQRFQMFSRPDRIPKLAEIPYEDKYLFEDGLLELIEQRCLREGVSEDAKR